ncbi:uncharacterized protein BX664DRAFT_117080 [Halteromyces radiatus]|uniref:uncharacterized protein n=1 Tax=Halteromyces radiatus TaxID=101107 RepID=UPI002220B165|nr:uncharacterized protein BX664DRAFT_117080 [Halteromyces radiatus]KAI8093921.1 hypothetical protein BX664DRAFT_117080 [Halteromyces radiatus]
MIIIHSFLFGVGFHDHHPFFFFLVLDSSDHPFFFFWFCITSHFFGLQAIIHSLLWFWISSHHSSLFGFGFQAIIHLFLVLDSSYHPSLSLWCWIQMIIYPFFFLALDYKRSSSSPCWTTSWGHKRSSIHPSFPPPGRGLWVLGQGFLAMVLESSSQPSMAPKSWQAKGFWVPDFFYGIWVIEDDPYHYY